MLNKDLFTAELEKRKSHTFFPGGSQDCPLARINGINVKLKLYKENGEWKPLPKWARQFNMRMLAEAKRLSSEYGVYPVHVPMSGEELLRLL